MCDKNEVNKKKLTKKVEKKISCWSNEFLLSYVIEFYVGIKQTH